MPQSSIRFRLTAWYSLALGAGLALFGVSVWASMRESLLSDVNRTLAERAHSVQLFVNHELREPDVQLREELDEYSHALPPGTFMRVAEASGSVVFESREKFPWPAFSGLSAVSQHPVWRGQHYLVVVTPAVIDGREWSIFLAAPLAETDYLLNRLRFLLLLLSPLVFALATLGGLWLSRRALKPVDDVTAAARSIGIENLSQRLAVPQTGDELQRLSETWNEMLSRLENAVTRISRFTADASHELRTPLAVIRSTAELALRRPRTPQAYSEALAQIASESEHMTALIDDLLFLARSDADALELPMTALDLASLTGVLCSRLELLARRNRIRLHSAPPANATWIRGNEDAVRRLILVLLDNAIKYSRPGGDVNVELGSHEREVLLSVRDSGPGIPAAESQRIFERFYRSPKARQADCRGAGLGLSLAAGIARYHGAQIRIESNPEVGSTFTVVFPLAEVSPASPHPALSDLR
ncbi:MAG: HAMP domain-containing histidine kinase [Acidobacteriaceae bacterium]|nr:HAMP domain-containing histidine kinase [Acidobacteriaceae bacterium]